MNAESILKLQSWVDGELPAKDAQQVAQWVSTDPEAAALAAELKQTRRLLANNEPEFKLTESREFYWRQIERAIEQGEPVEAGSNRLPWMVALRRLLVPLGGFALVAMVTVLTIVNFGRTESENELTGQLVEVENLSDGVDSMSYKSQSENMFVVYVFNKDSGGDSEDDHDWDFDLDDDSVIQ